MVEAACEGLKDVSASQVEMNSNLQFYNGIRTEDIQRILINSAANLISEDSPDYQYVAARLMNIHLRKAVWGGKEPPTLMQQIGKGIFEGVYDKEIDSMYTYEELLDLNDYINHERDYDFTYAGIKQVYDKYLVQDRSTGIRYETPQFMYMLIAMNLFHRDKDKIQLVKDYYDAISQQYINLPTPILAGVRTPIKQYASCTLIECGDSLDSIFATSTAVGKYVAQRAGIGLHVGNIRGIKSKIRGGEVEHTGIIPFLKLYQATMGSCSQGGIRKGSATCYFPIWHWEIEDLIVLKNNQGSEDNRVRHLDYAVGLSKLFYERYINEEDITLFSPDEVPELVESFGMPEFDRLYELAEQKEGLRKRIIKATELIDNLMSERLETARIYIFNADHANTHSSFFQQLKMSNLCCEVVLPTKPFEGVDDQTGEIATCILSAINLGKIKDLKDMEPLCNLIVRALDNVIDLQEYPMVQAEIATKLYRPLGVGYINLAYYLAKNKLKWDSNEARQLIHETTESLQYYLLKASTELAKEKGRCSMNKYQQGILPIDTYKKDIDEFADFELIHDWEALRATIQEQGVRNSTLTAIMPSESSSVVANATNGIEPPREVLQNKKSQAGVIKILVPESKRVKYELLWDMPDNKAYLKIAAIIQKFVDQSLSTNTNYNPENYENNEIPLDICIEDMLLWYKWGGKTLYYNNTYDMNEEVAANDGCESGACAI